MGLLVIPLLLLNAMTVLVLGRAALDLANRALNGTLAYRTSNALRALQGVAVLAMVVAVRWSGGGIGAIVLGTGTIALVAAGFGGRAALGLVSSTERREPGRQRMRQPGEFSPGLSAGRFWRFVFLLYIVSISGYFTWPGFASSVLGVISDGVGGVALFNTGYQIPQTISVVLLSGFQGVYTPMFAHLLVTPDTLRTAYQEVVKVYAVLLIPAAAGLLVMLGDYIPLVYGPAFAPAVPIAQILTVALLVESFLDLGGILLTTAALVRPVLLAQSLVVLGAGPFLLAANSGILVLTAAIFPAGRLLVALVKHLFARRQFGGQFPWAFLARASLPSLVMVAVRR